MLSTRFPVDVLIRRIVLSSRWASERWQPFAVMPAAETDAQVEGESGTPLRIEDGPQGTLWRFPGFALELHRSEGEGYFLNLSAPDPAVFVMWRPGEEASEPAMRPVVVTLSYNEAARMLDAGEQVEPVPLHPSIHDWVLPFMHEHYKPEPRKKLRRNDPFAADSQERGRRGGS